MASTRKIQLAFAKQASGFADARPTLAPADYLEWMLRHLPFDRSCRVLDANVERPWAHERASFRSATTITISTATPGDEAFDGVPLESDFPAMGPG
jgi:hypothetical protein